MTTDTSSPAPAANSKLSDQTIKLRAAEACDALVLAKAKLNVREVRKWMKSRYGQAGRTAVVAAGMDEWRKAKDQEVSRLASEAGTSEIAMLVAAQINERIAQAGEDQRNQLEELEQRLTERQQLLAEAEAELDEGVRQAEEAIQIANERADKAIAAMRVELDKAREQVELAHIESNQAKESAKAVVDAKEQDCQARLSQAAESDAALKSQIESLNQQITKLSVNEAKHELLGQELAELREAHRELEGDAGKQLNELSTLRERENSLKATIEELRGRNEDQKQQLAQVPALQEQLADARTNVARLEGVSSGQKEEIRRLGDGAAKAEALQVEASALSAKMVEKQEQLTSVSHDLAAAERQVESMSRALTASESQVESLSRALAVYQAEKDNQGNGGS